MENVLTESRAVSRKNMISTTDIDSPVVDELQKERLRQSRVIARQLDTIGKLKRALDMIIADRSSRRSSVAYLPPIPDVDVPPEIDFCDIGLQTENSGRRGTDLDPDDVRYALSYLNTENQKLQEKHGAAEAALRTEREKAKRILTVCTRISSAPDSGISSPALAKWVSLGLEEAGYPPRQRTETFDDSILNQVCRFPVRIDRASASTRSRSALSEGDSPVAGLDLDMVYGSSCELMQILPDGAMPMTPRANNSFSSRFSWVTEVSGPYWSGSAVVVVTPSSKNSVVCIAHNQRVTISGAHAFALSATFEPSGMRDCLRFFDQRLHWSSGESWERLSLIDSLQGDWWTGFNIVSLKLTDGGSVSGLWGLKTVVIEILARPVDGVVDVIGTLGPGICMYGTVKPRYAVASDSEQVMSVLEWGNGQIWQQSAFSESN